MQMILMPTVALINERSVGFFSTDIFEDAPVVSCYRSNMPPRKGWSLGCQWNRSIVSLVVKYYQRMP